MAIFCKITTVTRKKKSIIKINNEEEDMQFEKFIADSSIKLNINGSSVVLENDGCEIDSIEILMHYAESKETIFMLLQDGEVWKKDIVTESFGTGQEILNIQSK